MSLSNQVVEDALRNYLSTNNFAGNVLQGWTAKRIKQVLIPLIKQRRISVRLGDLHLNPFIRHFPDPPAEKQIETLTKSNLDLVIVYPTKQELAKYVDPADYTGRPFTFALAQGYGHLEYRCFDLSVLEVYRNDPRYYYKVSDVFGAIYTQDDHANAMPESDRIFLKTFGFGYDKHDTRAVLAYLTYLHNLSPEHQQIWQAKLLSGKWMIHPDYYNSSICAMWSDHIPILDAFSAEIRHINEMSKLMGKPPLFHKFFERDTKPKGFTFLIRPTMKEFHDFVLLLDKAISENLNKDFFRGDIPLEEDNFRGDGKIEVRQKGTLRLLEEWITKYWTPQDPKPLQEMFETFREIRKLRQKPAHTVIEDTFDQSYFKQQRDLIKRAYQGVRLIRLIFAKHPAVKGYPVEPELYKGQIRDF